MKAPKVVKLNMPVIKTAIRSWQQQQAKLEKLDELLVNARRGITFQRSR